MPNDSDLSNAPAFPLALEALRQVSEGLLMLSESDAPFEAFLWPNAKVEELTPERVLALSAAPAETKVETVTLRAFFRNATKSEDWHNAEETAEVEKFKTLVTALRKELTDAKVFRVGATKIDCYVAGGVEGGCGGLKTQVVET